MTVVRTARPSRVSSRALLFLVLWWALAPAVWADQLLWSVLAVNTDGAVLSALPARGAGPVEGFPRFVARWPDGWQAWLVHRGPDGRWDTQRGASHDLDITFTKEQDGVHTFWLVVGSSHSGDPSAVSHHLDDAVWKNRDALVWLKEAEWKAGPLTRGKTRLPVVTTGSYRSDSEDEAESLELPASGWLAIRYDWIW